MSKARSVHAHLQVLQGEIVSVPFPQSGYNGKRRNKKLNHFIRGVSDYRYTKDISVVP